MPDKYRNPIDISAELQNFRSGDRYLIQNLAKDEAPSVIADWEPLSSPSFGRDHVHRRKPSDDLPLKKARAKESSKHFGVRFRPDLNKWVAEIRVAEWKTVDKKVWLGTYETEEGAARGVDAARKLLNCKKKRGYNFPCRDLDAFSEQIPSKLNLSNLTDDSMFKEVTIYVKRKAREYAASFCPSHSCVPVSSDQVPVIVQPSFYSQPHEEVALAYVDVKSLTLYESVGEYPGGAPSVSDDQWTFSSSPSSAGSSPEDDDFQLCDGTINSFQKCDIADMFFFPGLFTGNEQSVERGSSDDETMGTSPSSWEDDVFCLDGMEEMEDIMQDGMLAGLEDPSQMENQEFAQDQVDDATVEYIVPACEMQSADDNDCSSLMTEYSLQKPSVGLVDRNMDFTQPIYSYNYYFPVLSDYSQLCY